MAAQPQYKDNLATAKDGILYVCAQITSWSLWWAKLVIAIGLAYAAARMFSLGWLSLEGIRIPVPRVTAEPLHLLYMAGAIWALK